MPFDDDHEPNKPAEAEAGPADPFEQLKQMFGDLPHEPRSTPATSQASTDPAGTKPVPIQPVTPDAPEPQAAAGNEQTSAELPVDAAAEPPAPPSKPELEEQPQGDDLSELIATVDAGQPTDALAAPEASGATSEEAIERHIVFTVAGTQYGLAMGQVIEVGPVPAVTPLPQVPEWLLGVTNLRGDILGVLDFRLFLGHAPSHDAERHRMLVLQTPSSLTGGLVVDQVLGARSIDPATIKPPTAPVDDPVRQFLVGVASHQDRLVAILDADRLLNADELAPFAAEKTPSELLKPTSDHSDTTDMPGPSPIH
ncbi:MAG: chemotaxis protein CheW [Acidobacteriota bacterium]